MNNQVLQESVVKIETAQNKLAAIRTSFLNKKEWLYLETAIEICKFIDEAEELLLNVILQDDQSAT